MIDSSVTRKTFAEHIYAPLFLTFIFEYGVNLLIMRVLNYN